MKKARTESSRKMVAPCLIFLVQTGERWAMHRWRGFILALTRFCSGMPVPGPAQEPGAGMTMVKGA